MKVKLTGVSLEAISSCYPSNCLDNAKLFDIYGEQEVIKISNITGIKKVRIADKSTCTSDLCEKAAQKLFDELHVNPSEIDGIILVTQTPDYILPPTSIILQQKLGLSKDVVAFDINYGCSGFIYGLFQSSLLIQSGSCNKVLLLVGDVLSKYVNPDDKALRLVIGDAASAALIVKGERTMTFNIKSDGSGSNHLIIPAGGCRFPLSPETSIVKERENGNMRSDENLFMDGMEVLKFVLSEVPPIIEDLLQTLNWEKKDVGLFGMHQSNEFMVDYIRRRLKLSKDSVPIALQETGNTSSATIPLMLSIKHKRLEEENRLKKVVLCGFGVGLSWGAVGLDLSKCKIFDPIEYSVS